MTEPLWWKRGIIYQVYPRSFQDSDGNGIGDLAGIRSRLGYLEDLGVDAIWISPIYPSPMADFGYDVADYRAIDPIFGTFSDFDALIDDVHRRGLKVILDFVPNHTSDQHPWFVESRSSRTNPKRDWYIWRDPKEGGGPPNNWLSNFGGSGWEWDEATGQYYYHAFLKEQPDLNWHNPEVRDAMYSVLRFWLDRGVDGFRVDVIWHLIKDDRFRDNPANPDYRSGDASIRRFIQVYSADRPEVHEIIAEMRNVLEQYDARVLIGEIYLPLERLVHYYGKDLRGAHLPFNFQLIETAWDPGAIRRLIKEYEGALPMGGWPNWVLSNHDQKRIATRAGRDQARIAAMLLLTLRGTPTLYYGDEIGMESVPIPPELVRDPWEKNEPGLGLGRDPSRTPMQWDDSPNAGFTSGEPWLPVADDFEERNVACCGRDRTSILMLYRELIRLRRKRPALSVGDYRPLPSAEHTLVYERLHGADRLVVALNFSRDKQVIPLPGETAGWRTVLTSDLSRGPGSVKDRIVLAPNEGVILSPES
ncbi:MAG TPA: alpha-amylase family glycosyl hydrolase [Alphaproteobacteria bacterium]|nr:alpha-amylase family glycosyl hydrolase [Alphaproteobacteria bacterium]